MNSSNIRNRLLALIVVLGLLLPAAAAQAWLEGAELTGTVTGTLDGNEYTWHTYELQSPEGPQNTATYTVIMGMFEDFSVQAHQGGTMVEGALSLSFSSFSGPLADCPCEFQGDINYWTTSSMFDDVLIGADATIIVLEAERLEDGSYRLSGTAEGELLFYESVMNPVSSGEPVAVSVSFTIDRVTPLELDLD